MSANSKAPIRVNTHALGEVNQLGKPAHGTSSALGGSMVVVAGGLPVMSGKQVVGGIGVSSGSQAQDLEVAQAGILAFAETQT
jgi:uncharacterized protein GlcG (DUF336 family)